MSSMQPGPPHTRYSEDGFWWWDGVSWKPAVSPDRLWRWNGQTWIPAQQGPVGAPAKGPGNAILVSIGVFVGVLVLVSIIATLVFLSMGDQISNVVSNTFG
jgi:hypothetical protein